jgi:hypothetical protein
VKLRTLFTITAVVATLFGVALLLVPEPFTEFYNAELGDAGSHLGRLLGVAYIGFGIIAWMAKESQDSTARRAIILGYFVSFVLAFLVALIDQIRFNFSAMGWSTVVIDLLFAIGYGYFQFKPGKQN